MYSVDYEDLVPGPACCDGQGGVTYWSLSLSRLGYFPQPAGGAKSIVVCPAFAPNSVSATNPFQFTYGIPIAGDYTGTTGVQSVGPVSGNASGAGYYRVITSMGQYDALAADSIRCGGEWPQSFNINNGNGWMANTGSTKAIHFRHQNFTRANVAISDGHVEAVNQTFVTAGGRYYGCTRTDY